MKFNYAQEFIDNYCFEFHEAQFRGKIIPFRMLREFNFNNNQDEIDEKLKDNYYITPLGDKVKWIGNGYEINGKIIYWDEN